MGASLPTIKSPQRKGINTGFMIPIKSINAGFLRKRNVKLFLIDKSFFIRKNIIMKNQIKQILRSTKGKFFTLVYVKANGERRVACGQFKNIKALKGGESTHQFSQSIPYYDVNKKSYRAFNVNRLISIKCGNMKFNANNS